MSTVTAETFTTEDLAKLCGQSFESYREWIPSKSRPDLTPKEELSNATLGLVGEIGELLDSIAEAETLSDWMQIPDEIGDCLFYLAWIHNASDIPEPVFLLDDDFAKWGDGIGEVFDPREDIRTPAFRLAELVKKHAYHGKDLSEEIDELLLSIGCHLFHLAKVVNEVARFDGGLGRIVERNVIKLESRYPGGFVLGGGIRESK